MPVCIYLIDARIIKVSTVRFIPEMIILILCFHYKIVHACKSIFL